MKNRSVFILETSFRLPQGLVSLIGLLTMQCDQWEKTRSKGRLPKPPNDVDIRRIAETVLETRFGRYKTSLEVRTSDAIHSLSDSLC